MEHMFISGGDGWFLKINDLDHLIDYLVCEWGRRRETVEEDYRNLLLAQRSDDFSEYEKKTIRTHASNPLTMRLGSTSRHFACSVSEYIGIVTRDLMHGMMRVLEENGTVYVNPFGGYRASCPNVFTDGKPYEIYCKEGPDFPVFDKSNVEIKQWEGGRHYYAYIGDMPIYFEGKYRFDTEDEAKRAADHAIYVGKCARREREWTTGGEGEWRQFVLDKQEVFKCNTDVG